jgi:hypothetical protein
LFARAFRFIQVKAKLIRPFEVEVWVNKEVNVRVNDPVRYVSVFNNKQVLSDCLLSSNVSLGDVSVFDNLTAQALPMFFNSYVKDVYGLDCWIVFCHQDFVFKNDLRLVLAGKNANALYGVAGVRFGSKVLYGRIIQTNGVPLGLRLSGVEPVQTVDEMCIIVHSSLFRKGLQFDERFRLHFYGADLCMQALVSGFDVYALQLFCQHKSRTLRGDVDSESYISALGLFAMKWRVFLPIRTTTRIVDGDVL